MSEQTEQPDTMALLERAANHSLKLQAAEIAHDLRDVDRAMWERRGGIAGWLDQLEEIYKEERQAGRNKVALDILKMHLDVKVAAQKAGQRSADDMSDEELKETILTQIKHLAKQNPDVRSQLILATAKKAGPPTSIPRNYDFLK